MQAQEIKDSIRTQWSGAAAGWDKWFGLYERGFRPLTDWLCGATAIGPGHRVLDIACGTGVPALAEAERVRPGGHVTAIDFSRDMLQSAERRARGAGLENIEFLEMDAERLLFGDGSFQAVTCACGLMFCPEPERAAAEMWRVLEPGGRIGVAVWDEVEKNPFMTVAGRAVAQFIPPRPPDPKASGGFRLTPPGELEGVLRAGGFQEPSVESFPFVLDFDSVDQYWAVFTEMSAGMKARLATLPVEDAARLREVVDEAARPHRDGGRVRLTVTMLCASARK